MLFLLKDYYDVARFDVRLLITFAWEKYLLVLAHTLVDVYFQYLCFIANTFTFANSATILFVDDDPFSVAIGARRLQLLRHPRTDLPISNLQSAPSASPTLLCGTRLSALPLASAAYHIFTQLEFGRLPVVQILQRDFERMDRVLAALLRCVNSPSTTPCWCSDDWGSPFGSQP